MVGTTGYRWSLGWYGVPVLLAVGLLLFTGYAGLNGQDAHDYLHITQSYSDWFGGGNRPMMVEHPHGFSFAGSVLAKIVGDELLALRLLCAGALITIVVVMRRALIRVFGKDGSVDAFVLIGLALSPFLLRYSLIVLSDLPAIALMVIAFVCTCRWIEDGRVGRLLAAMLFSALACSVRFAVVPIVGVLALAWIYGPQHGRRVRLIIGILGMVIGIVLMLIMLPPDRIAGMVALRPLEDLSVLNLFRRELISDDGVLHYRFPNLVYVFSIVVHPGFIPIGVLLLPFVRRADLGYTHAKLALVIAIGYLLFVGCMPFQNDRVLLLAQPFVVLLLFPAFMRAWDFLGLKGINAKWVMVVIILVQSALFVRATLPFAQQADVERDLADRVIALGARHVYTHGMGAAFRTYCPAVEVTELWYGELSAFGSGAVIVVDEQNLFGQWQGRPPYINYEKAKEQGIDPVEIRRNGWVISRVR